MELLPPSVFKEEFHANSQIEVDWNRGENSSHHSSSNKPEFSQGIKNENTLFDHYYSCSKCFELCTLLINHQFDNHHSIDSDRRRHFFDILQQTELKLSHTSEQNENDFDYEIIATLVKIPRIKEEFNIIVEPTIKLSDINTNISSNDESNDYNAVNHNYQSDDDIDYTSFKHKYKKYRTKEKTDEEHPKVECDICGKFFNSKSIDNHKRKAHPKVKKKKLFNKTERKQHFHYNDIDDRQHNSDAAVDVKQEDLKLHNRKRIDRNYICDLCNDVSSSKMKILKHFKTVHQSLFAYEPPASIRRRKYDKECPVCSKTMNGLVAYRCHMKQYHPETIKNDNVKKEKRTTDNSMKILCDICGKGFSSDRLKVHKQSHSEARPHKCTICDRDYRQKKQLQDHMNTHTGDRPYKCVYDGCDKTFAHNSARHAHLKLMHGTVKNHKCEFCSKLFAIRYAYIIHRRVHTNERPHGCDVCGNKFKTRRHLLRHMQIHTQEKPHKCHLCNKGFADAMGLKQHHRAKRPCVVPSSIVCTVESNSSTQRSQQSNQPSQTIQSQPTPIYPEGNLYKL